MEELKQLLLDKPQLTGVYLNDKLDSWLLYSRPSHPNFTTRDEILGESESIEEKPEPKKKK